MLRESNNTTMKNSKKYITAVVALVVGFSLSAASCGQSTVDKNNSINKETSTAREQQAGFLVNQPIPIFNFSQLRQNLIELETAQAKGIATTTFFFNQGVADPHDVCASQGFPIPATYQLTNPDQIVNAHDNGVSSAVISQMESTGVYTSSTSGTYVICLDANGKAYANYDEGFVKVVAGPAKWDYDKHMVVLTGAPTGDFSTTKGAKP